MNTKSPTHLSASRFPLLGALLALVGGVAGYAQVSNETLVPVHSPTPLNRPLFAAYDAYLQAGPNKAAALSQMQTALGRRQQQLQDLMSSDPAAVLAAALPDNVREALPAEVRGLLEQRVSLQGDMEVAIEDGVNYSRLHHVLLSAGKRLQLHFAGPPPANLLTGDRVQVNGVQLGDALALTSSDASTTGAPIAGTSPSILPNTFGAQNTLVILVNFQDNTSQPFTTSDVQTAVFTTASNFYLENSFQQTWLTGDVAGWYTLPLSSGSCNYTSIATYAQQAAQNSGYALSNYTRFLYVFPQISACGWDGYSTLGGNPSNSWDNGSLQLQLIGHELGHAFGLNHSHGLNCGTAVYAASGCTLYEYGDYYDIMSSSTSMDFNAFQKERLGWLNYGAQPPITTVSASGSYTIAPYETQDSSPKALKILQSSSSGMYYYVESRRPIGFDDIPAFTNSYGYSNVINGVLVHIATLTNGNSSDHLNMNPSMAWDYAMALDVGQSYTDSTAGVTITTTSVTSTGATVQVNMGTRTCTPANPTVSISPGQSPGVAAGTPVSFTLTVTDNDSAACGTATFTLTSTVGSGWTSVLGNSTLALSPGASTSTTLQATSPLGIASGSYSVGATAANAAASYTASASATYVVSAQVCTHANPAIAISPSQSQGVPAGTAVPFIVSVTNNDNSACSASSFSLAASVPKRWTRMFTNSPLSLGPGTTGSATLQVTSLSSAAAGSYNIGVSATNASATSYTASTSAIYVIAAPLVQTPSITVSTDQTSYTSGQTVSVTVTLLFSSSPDAGAAVSVTITRPNGSTASLSGTTGSNGVAVLTYKLRKQDPTGTYQVQASTNASGNSASAVASTTFTVQ